MKNIYLILAIIGFIIPYGFLSKFIYENGVDIPLFFSYTFVNDISIFWTIDVIISAIVLIVYIFLNGSMLGGKKYIPIIGTLVVGVSFGLPLYFYMRENINKF